MKINTIIEMLKTYYFIAKNKLEVGNIYTCTNCWYVNDSIPDADSERFDPTQVSAQKTRLDSS